MAELLPLLKLLFLFMLNNRSLSYVWYHYFCFCAAQHCVYAYALYTLLIAAVKKTIYSILSFINLWFPPSLTLLAPKISLNPLQIKYLNKSYLWKHNLPQKSHLFFLNHFISFTFLGFLKHTNTHIKCSVVNMRQFIEINSETIFRKQSLWSSTSD